MLMQQMQNHLGGNVLSRGEPGFAVGIMYFLTLAGARLGFGLGFPAKLLESR